MSQEPIRVAVVDDLPVVRSGLTNFLQSAEDLVLVGEASDGEEAVQLCELAQPDVVLMDLAMPNMDGVSATRIIYQRWPHIKVLALGAFRDQKLMEEALEAGAASYLVKDFTPKELQEAVRRAFTGRRIVPDQAAEMISQSESLRQLEYELRKPWRDADELSELLRQHLPSIFPRCQVRVRIYPAQDLAIEERLDAPVVSEPAWKWLRSNPGTQIYRPGDVYPWLGEQPAGTNLILTSLLLNPGSKPIGGVGLIHHGELHNLEYALQNSKALAALLAHAVSAAQGRARSLWPANLAYELTEAARIQSSILPDKAPELRGWDITARLQPARETSGDFFDFIPLSNGNLGIVIADVTDKGMGAAMFMALSSTLIRTYAIQYPTLPAFAMSIVNERILSDTRGSMFVTAFYGVLEPHTGRLRYVNAGHPPPLLISTTKGKPVDELRTTGMALGMVEKTSWQQKVAKLSPGDLLLLYTDGITEAQNRDGYFFGEDRLHDLVRPHRDCSAQDVQNNIFTEVNKFAGDQATNDDMAVMVICRKG